MLECSVIILNWNGEAMLRRYLPSVIQYTQLDGVEIVVADNGSTDGSLAFLRSQPVRIIELGENYGFAEGYNRAIEQVESKYVVLLNSDVEVTPNWLDTLLNYARTHVEVVAIQPKILSWQSKEDALESSSTDILFEHAGASGGLIDVLGYPYCRGRFLSHVEYDHGQYDDVVPIFWASGACLFIQRDIYKEMGGLDAQFFAHQEEIDLCWRINSRGYTIVVLPQSVVYHLGGGALGYESPRKTYLNFRNNLLMLYKNLPASKLPWILLIRFFLDYIAAIQMLLTGKRLNASAVIKARCEFFKLRRMCKGKRSDIIRNAKTTSTIPISQRSIIFDYYVCGKRK